MLYYLNSPMIKSVEKGLSQTVNWFKAKRRDDCTTALGEATSNSSGSCPGGTLAKSGCLLTLILSYFFFSTIIIALFFHMPKSCSSCTVGAASNLGWMHSHKKQSVRMHNPHTETLSAPQGIQMKQSSVLASCKSYRGHSPQIYI